MISIQWLPLDRCIGDAGSIPREARRSRLRGANCYPLRRSCSRRSAHDSIDGRFGAEVDDRVAPARRDGAAAEAGAEHRARHRSVGVGVAAGAHHRHHRFLEVGRPERAPRRHLHRLEGVAHGGAVEAHFLRVRRHRAVQGVENLGRELNWGPPVSNGASSAPSSRAAAVARAARSAVATGAPRSREAMARFTITADQMQRESKWVAAALTAVLRTNAVSSFSQGMATGAQRITAPLPAACRFEPTQAERAASRAEQPAGSRAVTPLPPPMRGRPPP